ncbi:MAG: hypothetical protein IPK94_07210 [Saprospiraceae bacterium]|nr:hypothetical protein [Saprospiraceae bacterium]
MPRYIPLRILSTIRFLILTQSNGIPDDETGTVDNEINNDGTLDEDDQDPAPFFILRDPGLPGPIECKPGWQLSKMYYRS